MKSFAEMVPEGAEWVIKFDDKVGGATSNKFETMARCLYSAHAIALIRKP